MRSGALHIYSTIIVIRLRVLRLAVDVDLRGTTGVSMVPRTRSEQPLLEAVASMA